MSDIPEPQSDFPTFEELAADPEIAALLDFEPVPRKVKRPDNWTPELQREFVARLARVGSPTHAVAEMGKRVGGIQAIYKEPGAASFRGSWDAAIALAEQRKKIDRPQPWVGDVPGMKRRGAHPPPWPSPSCGEEEWAQPDDEPEMDLDEKLALIERLAQKFLRKVVAEREARLAGEVVAADFYLRQVTALEVIFDLLTDGGGGMDAWDHLKALQRGGHNIAQIVDTPFARYLDDKRREYWAASGEPMRPVAFAQEFLLDHGDHRTAADQNGYGACTTPARGYSAEAWAAMSYDEQRSARVAQFQEDADQQVRWEQQAQAEFEARQLSPSPLRGGGRDPLGGAEWEGEGA